jgi:hypothetical protein
MLGEKLREIPAGVSGVYCMYDLDDQRAYVGRTSDLRGRLRQHLIRQDSSVVSYGRLDIWDLSRIEWWETDEDEAAERDLVCRWEPYLNFSSDVTPPSTRPVVEPSQPDGCVRLISEEEQAFRAQPYNRVKQKLEHLSRMADKIKLAGHSDATKRTVFVHEQILAENISEFLDVDRAEAENFRDE